jgi:hypothetical protein
MVRCILLLSLILWLLPVPLQALETIEEVNACMEANQPKGSSIQRIAMRSKDRIGAITEMRAKIYHQMDDDERSKMHMAFDAPPDLRGSAMLMLEGENHNDTFMYLPELKKTRRVTTSMMNGSMFGSDFTYEEFQQMQGMMQGATSEFAGTGTLGDVPVYLVEQTPRPEDESDYDLIRNHVDQETCVTLLTEFIGKGDQVRKTLETDRTTVSKEGDVWLPHRMTMVDQIEKTETEVLIEEVEMGAEIPRKFFSKASLERMSH